MGGLKYSDAIEHMLKVLPDIRQYYEKREKELYAEGSPHVLYGSILVEYIHALVDRLESADSSNAERMPRQVFNLIEELSASSDFESRCLAETSVLEALLGEKGGLERFASYMGPETKKLARGLAESWGLNTELL